MEDKLVMADNSNNNQAAQELLEKLRSALQSDGDFPASAHVVSELKALTSNPQTSASQITEIILREPSLGTRVLHLVNSSFYRRAKPIVTVSQAVMQIGMRPLAELCSGLILLQKFVPDARRGGAFATCIQKTIVTSLLSSQLGNNGKAKSSQEEQGYLIGSFSEMGMLLLAYYFPKVYEAAAKRAQQKNTPIEQSVFEISGLTPLQLSAEVLKALSLPEYFQQAINTIIAVSNETPLALGPGAPAESVIKLSKAVAAAQDISRVIVSHGNTEELAKVIKHVEAKYGISSEVVAHSLQALPTLFADHCDALELSLPQLPASIINLNQDDEKTHKDVDIALDSTRLERFLDDIRKAVENKEPTATIITAVMETLAWSLGFDRVILLLFDKQRTKLMGRIALGDKVNFDPRSVERILASLGHYAPDGQTIKSSRPVFMGDPILPNGHPLACLPIGKEDKMVGVIYADRVDSTKDLIESSEQSVILSLTDLLNKSVMSHARN